MPAPALLALFRIAPPNYQQVPLGAPTKGGLAILAVSSKYGTGLIRAAHGNGMWHQRTTESIARMLFLATLGQVQQKRVMLPITQDHGHRQPAPAH